MASSVLAKPLTSDTDFYGSLLRAICHDMRYFSMPNKIILAESV